MTVGYRAKDKISIYRIGRGDVSVFAMAAHPVPASRCRSDRARFAVSSAGFKEAR
jgi:hypothetical protein